MLRGEPFANYKDPQLLNERKWCEQAVNMYNEAANPEKNYSLSSRVEFMQKILSPRRRAHSAKEQENHWGPEGEVGPLTIIEVPFRCDYGYNVRIGKECAVSANCHFEDAGPIRIGDRVNIAHNVQILTIVAPISAKQRKGSEGLIRALSVRIEDDVFIGAGAIILPGRTIGKGAVVGAGSIVTKVRFFSLFSLLCFALQLLTYTLERPGEHHRCWEPG